MKRTILFVLVSALGLASVSLATEGVWTTKADMPTERWDLSTCVVDGKVYAIGGASPVYQASRVVEAYDPATDTWTTKSEMATAREALSTSVVNGKIYAIGGGVSPSTSYMGTRVLSTVEAYDPATDTWTTKSEMPTSRAFHSASVVDGRIYVIGGSPSYPFRAVLALDVYDPATDTWTRKGDMPRGIYTGCFTGVVDGKIYVMGGDGSGRRVDEYDSMTDTWTRKADMPTYTTDQSTCVLEGKIYVIGGEAGSPYRGFSTVDVYDPATDTWTTAPDMPTGRFGLRTSVVDRKIYAIGGMSIWIGTALRTVEEYDPYPLVVDFNGDYQIDIDDLILLIECWGQDEPTFDIAPRPFGDGIVDRADLEVLMTYWAQDVFDPYFLAHWKMDESEGDIASDSITDNAASVIGNATWLPDSGQTEGAIQLDGVGSYLAAPHILNPADGVFGAFAWVKGGAPGQVILSQENGLNWLMLDAQGNLKTSLRGGTRLPDLNAGVMLSSDTWQHVGCVWNGESRVLYIDDVEVARDSHTAIDESLGGLIIGAGAGLEDGTFFSGLIDDVRIYDRVVEP